VHLAICNPSMSDFTVKLCITTKVPDALNKHDQETRTGVRGAVFE
jgi:hypothetical protein